MTHTAENDAICKHAVPMSEFCSDCVGFSPVTCSPACDWCGDPPCGFCARQGAPIPPGSCGICGGSLAKVGSSRCYEAHGVIPPAEEQGHE